MENVFVEPAREIPVTGSWDVIVAGGGTAGAIAAIAAARNGMRTLVVEQFGFLGGSATAALVTPLMTNTAAGRPLTSGISNEIRHRLFATGDGGEHQGNDGWFNPEMLKFVLEDMALEAGVELLYHTLVVEAITESEAGSPSPRALRGLIVENKSGRRALLAKVVIDATGDADVAARAGVPWESGRQPGGLNQAMSLRFHLGNVDIQRLATFLTEIDPRRKHTPPLIEGAMVWGGGHALEPFFRKAVEEGVLKEEDGNYFQFFSMPGRPGELSFNCPRINEQVNGADASHLTHAQIAGRQAILRLANFCRRYLSGCEKAYVTFAAPMVGVRESRRILGEYVLTLGDILSARKFPDAVARNAYPVDIHVPAGGDGSACKDGTAAESGTPGDSGKKDSRFLEHRPGQLPPGEYHEIPYRCLVPREVDNLLVAGRSISATFEAQSSIRIQLNCRALGQAAGTAAALAIQRGIRPRELGGVEVRQALIKQGIEL